MGQAPTLVLVCGLLSAGMGVALLVVSDRVAGLVWLATVIVGLGLSLVGLWVRSRVSGVSDEGATPPATERLPGRWYPFAVIGIGAALGAWAVYWTKFR